MFIVPLFLLAACGGEEPKPSTPKSSATKADASWRMASDPGDALSVAEAKEKLPEGEVLVVGRIRRMVPGYAVFQLTDDVKEYCGEVDKEDTCKTPWDYCCDPQDEINALTLGVQFEKENGDPAMADLSGDLRHCDLVVVRGTVTKDEQGNVIVHAKEFYRRQRPTLPDYVKFP
jgi:hypothetical protein